MTQAVHKMGGDSVVTNTEAVLFSDNTEQSTAAPVIQTGSVAFAGSSSGSANFAEPFITEPTVVCSPMGGVVPIPFINNLSLIVIGGLYTGFNLSLASSWTGGGYNYVAVGNPN